MVIAALLQVARRSNGAEIPWRFRVTASIVPAVGRLAGAY
jgi:hypothetical protein